MDLHAFWWGGTLTLSYLNSPILPNMDIYTRISTWKGKLIRTRVLGRAGVTTVSVHLDPLAILMQRSSALHKSET